MAKASNSGNGKVIEMSEKKEPFTPEVYNIPEPKPASYAPMTAPDRVEATAKLVAESVRAAITGTVQSIQKLLDEAQSELNAVVAEANIFCTDLTRIGGDQADRIERSLLDIRAISQRVIDERKRYLDANPGVPTAPPDARAAEVGEKFAASELAEVHVK